MKKSGRKLVKLDTLMRISITATTTGIVTAIGTFSYAFLGGGSVPCAIGFAQSAASLAAGIYGTVLVQQCSENKASRPKFAGLALFYFNLFLLGISGAIVHSVYLANGSRALADTSERRAKIGEAAAKPPAMLIGDCVHCAGHVLAALIWTGAALIGAKISYENRELFTTMKRSSPEVVLEMRPQYDEFVAQRNELVGVKKV